MSGTGDATAQSSVMRQIAQAQNGLEKTRYRIDVIEKSLQFKEMTMEERERLEKELQEIKKILSENESNLNSLHEENRRTTSMAGLLFAACLCMYCLYALFTNPN